MSTLHDLYSVLCGRSLDDLVAANPVLAFFVLSCIYESIFLSYNECNLGDLQAGVLYSKVLRRMFVSYELKSLLY